MKRILMAVFMLVAISGISQQEYYYRWNHYGIRADRGKFDSLLTSPWLNYFPQPKSLYDYGSRQFSSAGSFMMYQNPTDSTPANWPYWYDGTKWFTMPKLTASFDTACYALVSGGLITRIGLTLCYDVTTVKFKIGCRQYTALSDTVCLQPPPISPLRRITIIYADTLGNISTRSSDDLEDPAKPSIDFTKEFELGFIWQEDNETQPPTVFPNYIYFGINGVPYGSPNFRYDSVSRTMSIYGAFTGDRWDITGDYWYHSQASGAQRQEFLRRAGSNLTQAGGVWRFGEQTVRPSLTSGGFDMVRIAQDEAFHTGIGWPAHKQVGLYTDSLNRFYIDSNGNAFLNKADTIVGPTYVLGRETGTNRLVSVLMQGSSTPYVDSLYKTGNTVFWQKNGNTYSFSDNTYTHPAYPNNIFYGENSTGNLLNDNLFTYNTINNQMRIGSAFSLRFNTEGAIRARINGRISVNDEIHQNGNFNGISWELDGGGGVRRLFSIENQKSLNFVGTDEDYYFPNMGPSNGSLNFVAVYDSGGIAPLVFDNPLFNQYVFAVVSPRRAMMIPQITTARLNNMRFLYRQRYGDYEANGYKLQEGMIAFDVDTKCFKYSRDTGWVSLCDILPGGTTETASNLGAGTGIYAQKVANDFQFKSLVAGTNVSISSDANTVTINAAGSTYTANNGLTMSANNTKLGGTLIENTTIANGVYELALTSSTRTSSYLFRVSNSAASGSGIYVEATGATTGTGVYSIGTAIGVLGISTNGTGLTGQSTSGYGLQASTTSGTGAYISSSTGVGLVSWGGTNNFGAEVRTIASTPGNIIQPLVVGTGVVGTAIDGSGTGIGFDIERADGFNSQAAYLNVLWQTIATQVAQMEFKLGNNGTFPTAMTMFGSNRQLRLNAYGSGTLTGTATKYLAVEADGDVIEVDAPGGGGTTETASNGLNKAVNDIRLGGTLTQATSIATGVHGLSLTTNNANNTLSVYNYGGAQAVTAVTSTGIALYTQSESSYSIYSLVIPASTNTIVPNMQIRRQSQGSPAAGIGTSIDFYVQVENGGFTEMSNKIVSRYTTVTTGNETSEMYITGRNLGTENTLLTLAGSGALKANKYGTGAFTGTAAYTLQVDASGNIIEGALGGGSGMTYSQSKSIIYKLKR